MDRELRNLTQREKWPHHCSVCESQHRLTWIHDLHVDEITTFGVYLRSEVRGKLPTALRRCILKTEVSIIFSQENRQCHTLYTFTHTQPPQSVQTWRWGSDWGLENRDWNVYSSAYLENEGYYLVAPSAEKKNQTSTSHCKESTGGAVVKWPQRNRKAGQPQPKQLRNPPLFLLFPLQSTFRKPEKLWRKLDMTKQKFEQRINSLVVNFTLEVKLTANNIIPDWILAIHHSPCG